VHLDHGVPDAVSVARTRHLFLARQNRDGSCWLAVIGTLLVTENLLPSRHLGE
jgi:hypothetical protein